LILTTLVPSLQLVNHSGATNTHTRTNAAAAAYPPPPRTQSPSVPGIPPPPCQPDTSGHIAGSVTVKVNDIDFHRHHHHQHFTASIFRSSLELILKHTFRQPIQSPTDTSSDITFYFKTHPKEPDAPLAIRWLDRASISSNNLSASARYIYTL
jgi:hypothetical protein